jgi:predicted HAD superfamily hydrolase
MWPTLKAKIKRAEVVSFDIFDTAILRALTRPDDLFLLMQADVAAILGSGSKPFWSARIAAEREARGRVWETTRAREVTLNDIYQSLGSLLEINGATAEKICQLEIEAEKSICRQNPFIHGIYRRCLEQRKRVAFISDTYLPEPVIADILRRNGYAEYEALLVSCAVGKTKWAGELYDEALARLGCLPAQWLHIGDNRAADIRRPRKRGIATWQYERCAERFAKDRVLSAAWTERAPSSPAAYVVQGLLVNRLAQHRSPWPWSSSAEDFWQDFGYRAAGPLLVGFVEWIIERAIAQEFEALYFLARDGLIIKKVYDALRPPELNHVAAHYLYASRRAMNFAAISELDEKALAFIMHSMSVNEAGLFLRRIGLDWQDHLDAIHEAGLQDPHQKIVSASDFQRLRRLMMLLAEPICDRASKEGAVLRDYLVSSGLRSGRRVALIDIGWICTQHKSILKILSKAGEEPAITGLYLGTYDGALPLFSHEGYLFRLGQPRQYGELILYSVPVVELLFAAIEGSVSRMERDASGKFVPVRHDEAELTDDHKSKIRRLQKGAMQFVEDYRSLKRDFPSLSISRDTAIAELGRILRHPSPLEAQNLGNFPFMLDFGIGIARQIAPQFNLLTLVHRRRRIWPHHGYNVIPWLVGHHARSSRLYRILYRTLVERRP